MQSVTVRLQGETPYSQSAPFLSKRENKESADEFEKRCWKERAHAMPDGRVFIPPMALVYALQSTAQLLGMQVKGRGKSTYTKHFKAGVLITDPMLLSLDSKPVMVSEVEGKWYYVDANGKRGSGTRVWRCYPEIPAGWETEATIYVLDDTITREVFEEHLFEAGRFRGLGRFRPENGGFFGRFTPEKFQWTKVESKARANGKSAEVTASA